MPDKPKKMKTYRVWIEQVNQTYVEVRAHDRDEARDKAYRKWRRDDAHSHVSYIVEMPNHAG